MDLPITLVIAAQVALAGAGIRSGNTSNLALFTEEVPIVSFGTDKYKAYRDPTEVAKAFGSDSKTYKMALAVFSQTPNILGNQGVLIVIPLIAETQEVTLDAVPASGAFKLVFTEGSTADINFDDAIADIQTKVRAIEGLEQVDVTGSLAAGLTIEFKGVNGDQDLIGVADNTLADAGAVAVNIDISEVFAGESVGEAVTRTVGLVSYFGVMQTFVAPIEAQLLEDAAVIQAYNKIAFTVSRTPADVEPAGKLDKLRTGSLNKTRGLFYGSDNDLAALIFMASYAGRALSVIFTGSLTTTSMHLKDLAGVQPDPSMDGTLLGKCQAAGVDVYVSISGVAKTFISGKNKFFDQVYNLGWFLGEVEVAYFNVLAQTGTKVPQTEQGIDLLRSAVREVCKAAIKNGYGAPGKWTRPSIFGNQEDFHANIGQLGFYLYAEPVSEQLPSDREARIAPVIQIALKEAGAVHSGNILINVNA